MKDNIVVFYLEQGVATPCYQKTVREMFYDIIYIRLLISIKALRFKTLISFTTKDSIQLNTGLLEFFMF